MDLECRAGKRALMFATLDWDSHERRNYKDGCRNAPAGSSQKGRRNGCDMVWLRPARHVS